MNYTYDDSAKAGYVHVADNKDKSLKIDPSNSLRMTFANCEINVDITADNIMLGIEILPN